MLMRSTAVASAVLLALWAFPTSAQSNRSDDQEKSHEIEPKTCAPSERLEQGSRGSEPPARVEQGDSASDKLSRGEGVICPPNIDPGIKVPTPDAGKMPVIPPPGSPGGDPNVRPK
jgi:hypothetical protein